MRFSTLLIFLGLCFGQLQAQYYTIPDWNFRGHLHAIVPDAISGNQLDTTHISVLSLAKMNVTSLGIIDLDGVQHFTALDTLYCGNNSVSSLPELPPTLRVLRCNSNNWLTSLPTLPSTLEILYGANNHRLDSLPVLPASLVELDVFQNDLSSLPTLPPSLKQLNCSFNNLDSLPELPASLEWLSCSYNDTVIRSLPELPISLKSLLFQGNGLTSMPELPDSLEFLACPFNNLLIMPELPSTLITLSCSDNALDSLPELPATLERLEINDNGLDSLPELPATLERLEISSNGLNSLPALPNSLKYLDCSANDLHTLPELPDSLETLNIRSNPIQCLPALPDSLIEIISYYTNISCLPNIPSAYVFDYSDLGFGLTVCDLGNTACPIDWEAVGGTVFYDINGDGVKDVGEDPIAGVVVEAQPGNYLSESIGNGTYVMRMDTGTFILEGQPLSYHNQTTVPYNIILAQHQVDSFIHIGYQAIPGIYDLIVGLEAQPARPGFDNTLWLQVHNIGTESTTTNIELNFDADQNWVGSTEVPDSQSGNNATWSPVLAPGDSWSTAVTLNTGVSIALGTPLIHVLSALPQQPDTTLADNTAMINTEVVGSYDPNDKLLEPESMSIQELQTGQPMEYTIRFQNTGTFYAERVLITDTLSSDLEWGSMDLVSSSHTCTWFIQDGVLHFLFDPIFLPDSTTDEPNSHGFVKFRMQPSLDLVLGDEVENVANIYFDFNDPIVTEPAVFSVELIDGIEEVDGSQISLWPNPTDGILQVVMPEQGHYELQVLDPTGKLVRQTNFTGQSYQMDSSDLANGLYFIQLQSEGRDYSGKFIKQ